MTETHVSIVTDKSGNAVKFDSPGLPALQPGAGQTIVPIKDGSGNVVKVSGQVPNSTVIVNNPG